MGSVHKLYCDACSAEIEHQVSYKLRMEEVAATPTYPHVSDLCGTCYGKIMVYYQTLAATAEATWRPPEPAPVEYDPKEVEV